MARIDGPGTVMANPLGVIQWVEDHEATMWLVVMIPLVLLVVFGWTWILPISMFALATYNSTRPNSGSNRSIRNATRRQRRGQV